jgi:Cd2+/Zn2+-exporting ATPase
VERRSEHPLAEAIRKAADARGIDAPNPTDFQALAGLGARALIDGRTVHVGNHHLFDQNGLCTPELDREMAYREAASQSVVIVGDEKRAVGIIILADELRDNAAEAMRSLRKAGISKLIMLTGDHTGTANAIASKLDIDEVHAELLPQDKLKRLRDLMDVYKRVGMVGDGINDAPALAAATVGFAMGSAGTDAALETADVALMSDDLSKLAFTIRLSRRTLSIIRGNIVLAIGIKAVFLALAVSGLATLWMAVFADMGASLIVVANSLRLLGYRKKSGQPGGTLVTP